MKRQRLNNDHHVCCVPSSSSWASSMITHWTWLAATSMRDELKLSFSFPFQMSDVTIVNVTTSFVNLLQWIGIDLHSQKSSVVSPSLTSTAAILSTLAQISDKQCSSCSSNSNHESFVLDASLLHGQAFRPPGLWSNPKFAEFLLTAPRIDPQFNLWDPPVSIECRCGHPINDIESKCIIGVVSMVEDLLKELWMRVQREIIPINHPKNTDSDNATTQHSHLKSVLHTLKLPSDLLSEVSIAKMNEPSDRPSFTNEVVVNSNVDVWSESCSSSEEDADHLKSRDCAAASREVTSRDKNKRSVVENHTNKLNLIETQRSSATFKLEGRRNSFNQLTHSDESECSEVEDYELDGDIPSSKGNNEQVDASCSSIGEAQAPFNQNRPRRYGVRFNPTYGQFCGWLRKDGREFRKCYAVRKFGFDGAYRRALRWRLNKERTEGALSCSLEEAIKEARKRSVDEVEEAEEVWRNEDNPMRGVRGSQHRWICDWSFRGERHIKLFPRRSFGDEAKQCAIKLRRKTDELKLKHDKSPTSLTPSELLILTKGDVLIDPFKLFITTSYEDGESEESSNVLQTTKEEVQLTGSEMSEIKGNDEMESDEKMGVDSCDSNNGIDESKDDGQKHSSE